MSSSMKNLPTSNSIFLCASLYAQVIQSPCHEANQSVVTGFERVKRQQVGYQFVEAEPVETYWIRPKP
jgi:hypothetical protein